MMLAHINLPWAFEWKGNNFCSLVVENPTQFYNWVTEIYNQVNNLSGNFVVSEHFEPMEFGKTAELIVDFLNIDNLIENKKILTAIQKELSEVAIHDLQHQTTDLFQTLNEYLNGLIFASDKELIYDEIYEISAILKVYNLRPDTTTLTFAEKLLLYLELCTKYLKKKLFIFVNLHTYLSDDNYKNLTKDILLRKYNVLMIESKGYTLLPSEQRMHLDEDLCEI